MNKEGEIFLSVLKVTVVMGLKRGRRIGAFNKGTTWEVSPAKMHVPGTLPFLEGQYLEDLLSTVNATTT
jgi:hypothetical protein